MPEVWATKMERILPWIVLFSCFSAAVSQSGSLSNGLSFIISRFCTCLCREGFFCERRSCCIFRERDGFVHFLLFFCEDMRGIKKQLVENFCVISSHSCVRGILPQWTVRDWTVRSGWRNGMPWVVPEAPRGLPALLRSHLWLLHGTMQDSHE